MSLTIKRAAWCAEAARLLAATVRRAPCCTVEDYRRMLEADPVYCGLYRVSQGAQMVGFVVLRIEHFSNGAEGVILAGVGKLPGEDLTVAAVPLLEKMFGDKVRGYRIATARAGLVRKLAALGYKATHTVLRKAAA